MIIYKITNKINGKVYIGKTEKSIEHRWKKHVWCAEKKVNRYLYDAMNKYGYVNFSIEEIDHCADRVHLDEREKFWIMQYKSMDKRFGYNMQEGGHGGTHCPETLARIGKLVSIRNKGHLVSKETRKKLSVAHLGKKMSLESRLKMSKTRKQKILSGEIVPKLPPIKYGKDHHGFGKHHSAKTKKLLSKAMLGKTFEERIKDKDTILRMKAGLRERFIGKNNPLYKDVDMDRVVRLISCGVNSKVVAKIYRVCRVTILNKFKKKMGMTIDQYRKTNNIRVHTKKDENRKIRVGE